MTIDNINDLLTAGIVADKIIIRDTHGNALYNGSVAGIPASLKEKAVVHLEAVPDEWLLLYVPFVDPYFRDVMA